MGCYKFKSRVLNLMASITDKLIERRASMSLYLRLLMFRDSLSQQCAVLQFRSAPTVSFITRRPPSASASFFHTGRNSSPLLRLHGALQSQVRCTPAQFNTVAAPVTVALTMRLSLFPQAACSDPSPNAPDLRSAQGVEAQEEIPWSHADYHRHASFAPCMWLGA